MKIPLQVYDFAGGLRAMAHFWLINKDPHIFATIKAMVDTGSPKTILGYSDIKRIRLSSLQLKKIEGRKEMFGSYEGKGVNAKILPDSKLKFEDFEFSMPIDVSIDQIENQPTVLGVDFMEKNKLKLVFDPINKEAYFESSESRNI